MSEQQQQQQGPVASVCLSGGAEGADTAWANAALRAGHKVVIMSFEGHKALVPKHPNAEWRKLSQFTLDAARPALSKATATLGKYPARNIYVLNLLTRNFYQQVGSQAVYAITDF